VVISSDNTLDDTGKGVYVQTNGRRVCQALTRELEEQVMGLGLMVEDEAPPAP
jgi:hypothetical protein